MLNASINAVNSFVLSIASSALAAFFILRQIPVIFNRVLSLPIICISKSFTVPAAMLICDVKDTFIFPLGASTTLQELKIIFPSGLVMYTITVFSVRLKKLPLSVIVISKKRLLISPCRAVTTVSGI